MLLIFLIRYNFNGYAVPCEIVRVQRRRRATCCGPRSRTSTWPAPGPRVPSPRSGEPCSTLIGDAARATRGCLAPQTHKYPDAVSPDFRTTLWLVLVRYRASIRIHSSLPISCSRSRYLDLVRVRERSLRSRGRGGETFDRGYQVRFQ